MAIIISNQYLSRGQMRDNAQKVLNLLTQAGFTKESACAIIGNMETESTLNPGIFENLDYGNMRNGFGLVQWTPATNYINWSQTPSGYANYSQFEPQIKRINWEFENGQQYYPTNTYPDTARQFKTSTKTPEYLAMAFLYNYERPADYDQPNRATQARYWYNLLEGGGTVSEPYTMVFAHSDVPPYVKVGDIVRKGDLISRTGNSGFSRGDHLHYTAVKGKVEDRGTWFSGYLDSHQNILAKEIADEFKSASDPFMGKPWYVSTQWGEDYGLTEAPHWGYDLASVGASEKRMPFQWTLDEPAEVLVSQWDGGGWNAFGYYVVLYFEKGGTSYNDPTINITLTQDRKNSGKLAVRVRSESDSRLQLNAVNIDTYVNGTRVDRYNGNPRNSKSDVTRNINFNTRTNNVEVRVTVSDTNNTDVRKTATGRYTKYDFPTIKADFVRRGRNLIVTMTYQSDRELTLRRTSHTLTNTIGNTANRTNNVSVRTYSYTFIYRLSVGLNVIDLEGFARDSYADGQDTRIYEQREYFISGLIPLYFSGVLEGGYLGEWRKRKRNKYYLTPTFTTTLMNFVRKTNYSTILLE